MPAGTASTTTTVTANSIDFACFEAGEGPLALCLHGYPDTAYTWRHLLPALAEAGYHAVAPFNRGYSPTSLAPDGRYQGGLLGTDANALHEAFGAGDDAVIIGHDWGAVGAYAALNLEPTRWRRAVTMAVPPPGVVAIDQLFSYDQLLLSWYMFFQLHPLSELAIPLRDYEYIRRLWQDWSPGYDGTADVDHFIEAMATPAHLAAALSYYRHTLNLDDPDPDPVRSAAQAATFALPDLPLLYLHGTDDGCMAARLASGADAVLTRPDSRAVMVDGVGHFLHLEQPAEVNALIIEFLGSP